jgi:hypothetical protein
MPPRERPMQRPVPQAGTAPQPGMAPSGTGPQVRPEPADIFVYRDMSSVEDDLAAAAAAEREAAQRLSAERAAAERAAAEREAEYWYGPPGPDAAPESAGETRGPFEPIAASGPVSGAVAPEPVSSAPEEPEEPAERHAQKLEQIKDFYLTAEAIGEKNVDKHFDQLLAQQRELISQYFKDSAAGRSEADQADAEEEATEADPAQADVAW